MSLYRNSGIQRIWYKTQCLRLRRNCCCNQYFCKLAALMTSTITCHWLSNYKKLSQVLIYSKIFYFALAFKIKVFKVQFKWSYSDALLFTGNRNINPDLFPFSAASSLYKTIIIKSCCFNLYKNKHTWFVHNKSLKILNSQTQKTLKYTLFCHWHGIYV